MRGRCMEGWGGVSRGQVGREGVGWSGRGRERRRGRGAVELRREPTDRHAAGRLSSLKWYYYDVF